MHQGGKQNKESDSISCLMLEKAGAWEEQLKMITAMGWEGVTYTVCGGDDDGTGDEGQAIVHAHLQGSFPAMTRGPDVLSMGCCEQQLESQTECLLPRGA